MIYKDYTKNMTSNETFKKLEEIGKKYGYTILYAVVQNDGPLVTTAPNSSHKPTIIIEKGKLKISLPAEEEINLGEYRKCVEDAIDGYKFAKFLQASIESKEIYNLEHVE